MSPEVNQERIGSAVQRTADSGPTAEMQQPNIGLRTRIALIAGNLLATVTFALGGGTAAANENSSADIEKTALASFNPIARSADSFAQPASVALIAGASKTQGAIDTKAGQSAVNPARSVASSEAVSLRYSKLKPQNVLNKIHGVLHQFSDDHTQNNNCKLGGYNPFPKVPCSHDRVLPTNAFLNPNAGGFKTNCENPSVGTYHYYKITPTGQSYHTCGPGVIPGGIGSEEQHTTPKQFQKKLNRLGNHVVQGSVNLSYQERVARVGGSRKRITAWYQCPETNSGSVATETPPETATLEGVKRIVIGRNHKAAITECQ